MCAVSFGARFSSVFMNCRRRSYWMADLVIGAVLVHGPGFQRLDIVRATVRSQPGRCFHPVHPSSDWSFDPSSFSLPGLVFEQF